MGTPYLRFRRLHIAPGIGVNLSRSGPSLTVGVRGAHVTLGGRGAHVTLGGRGVTRTVGLPGSGLFYTSRSGYHSGIHSAVPNPAGRTLGVFALGIIVGVAAVVVIIIIIAS